MVKRGNVLLLSGLMAGAIGPALFWLVVIVDGFTKPGYDAQTQTISELALGEQGWAQSANFIVVGLLMLAFALGLRLRFPAGKAAMFGPLFIALFGLGLMVSGIFPTDPPQRDATEMTTSGAIHNLAFLLILASVITACFVFARRFRQEPTWRGYDLYSVVTSLLVLGVLVAFVIQGDGAPFAGVFQRVLVAAFFLWIEVVALRALRRTRRTKYRVEPV
jgi:hypothetical membrane protein